MKEHLEQLLLIQYKQECLFRSIEQRGLNLIEFTVDNLEVVLDMVGFPRDNSSEYDYDHLNSGGAMRNESKKIMDNDLFCRDWLVDTWYDLVIKSDIEAVTFSSPKGFGFETEADKKVAHDKIATYVQWLYEELEDYKKEKFAGLAE